MYYGLGGQKKNKKKVQISLLPFPTICAHSRRKILVARGGIESPAHGFLILPNCMKIIEFQSVVFNNKAVAHDVCL